MPYAFLSQVFLKRPRYLIVLFSLFLQTRAKSPVPGLHPSTNLTMIVFLFPFLFAIVKNLVLSLHPSANLGITTFLFSLLLTIG